jgi:DNA repair protein RadC
MENSNRPRERLWRRGPATASDDELLAILLGTGVRDHPVLDVAAELVRSAGGIGILSRASPHELAQITGIGAARAARIAAAFELGRRAVEHVQHRQNLSRPDDVFHHLAPRLAGLAQEVFLVIGIDVRNAMLEVVEVARGSVSGVEVHPREVFRPLVRMAAAAAVVVHNHPSGDPTPSQEDLDLTRRLREVGLLVGIPILDHVVIASKGFQSIAEWLGADM